MMLKRALVAMFALVASGVFVFSAQAGDPSGPGPTPQPTPDEPGDRPVDVGRIRCPEPGVVRVLDPYVRIREGKFHPAAPPGTYAVFRVVTGFRAGMLYARRPNDDQTSRGIDLASGISFPPGTYRVKLGIDRGPWLIGCFESFDRGFSTYDHPDSDFGLVHVVKE